jgi:ubiquitin-conjugating enzyme E2 I
LAVLQILSGIQELLDSPNQDDPAQLPAYECLNKDPAEYKRRVRAQVRGLSRPWDSCA